MAKNSTIEWTQLTWNPVTGCSKISQGCKFCYAERMAKRLQAMGVEQYQNGFKLALAPQALTMPYNWKAPKLVFVNSMSDLFHERVPLDYMKKVFEVMNRTPQHTYQVLTKRSERLRELAPKLQWTKNIWMGVSIEHEKTVFRCSDLLDTSAAVKFISFEPLIGSVTSLQLKGIDWVIVGGESGPGARPIQADWVLKIKKECGKRKIPFFFKQWGHPSFNVDEDDPTRQKGHPHYAKGGCQLNGRIYREMPVRL